MKFLEHTHIINCNPIALNAACEDQFQGSVKSDVINMENAKSCVFVIHCTEGTGTASITIVCVDAVTAATTTTALSFNYKQCCATATPDLQGATTEAKALVVSATDKIFVLEVDAAKLAEVGYPYICMLSTEKSPFPIGGTVHAFLMGLRSAEDVTPTQLV